MANKIIVVGVLLLHIFSFQKSNATSTTPTNTATTRIPDSATSTTSNIEEVLRGFQGLSFKEKKSRFKELKKTLKKYNADKKAGNDFSTNTLLLVLLAILIPPLAVYLHEGDTNNRFWISVILTVLGYFLFSFAGIILLGSLPGIIYSLIIVLGS